MASRRGRCCCWPPAQSRASTSVEVRVPDRVRVLMHLTALLQGKSDSLDCDFISFCDETFTPSSSICVFSASDPSTEDVDFHLKILAAPPLAQLLPSSRMRSAVSPPWQKKTVPLFRRPRLLATQAFTSRPSHRRSFPSRRWRDCPTTRRTVPLWQTVSHLHLGLVRPHFGTVVLHQKDLQSPAHPQLHVSQVTRSCLLWRRSTAAPALFAKLSCTITTILIIITTWSRATH